MAAPQIYPIVELKDEQKSYIKAAVPLLELAGDKLTKAFYDYMLSHYPEVKVFFNEKNQADLRQPKLLAFALLAYAKNIDDITPLSPFVANIIDKHVSLQVKAEHYPIVGNSLITTMKSFLGDEIATPPFIEAWTAAYGNLAQILINAEFAKYQQQQWQGYKDFKVTRIVPETEHIKSLYLAPVDGTKIAQPLPGQPLGFLFKVPGYEFEKTRNYTISQTPVGNEYRISVKKVDGGACSTYVHSLKEGDIVKVSPPNGHFVYKPESKKDVLIFCAGVAITPFVSIIESALKDGKLVSVYYSNKTEKERPFTQWFNDLKTQYPKFHLHEFFSDVNRMTAKDFDSIDLKDKDVYMLGPVSYMDFVSSQLSASGVEALVDNYYPQIE